MDIFYIFLKFLGCSRADLEKDASAARWKFSESEEILGGNHGKLSYFPGFTRFEGKIWHILAKYGKIWQNNAKYACFVAKLRIFSLRSFGEIFPSKIAVAENFDLFQVCIYTPT